MYDCMIASDEKLKIDMNKKLIVPEMIAITMVAGIGDVISN